MAGNPALTRLLLGMGLRQFSMHPAQMLEVRQEVVMADTEQLAAKVARVLKNDETDKVRELVERL
jgi:phosphotransferase system enzyme I (PtsI)